MNNTSSIPKPIEFARVVTWDRRQNEGFLKLESGERVLFNINHCRRFIRINGKVEFNERRPEYPHPNVGDEIAFVRSDHGDPMMAARAYMWNFKRHFDRMSDEATTRGIISNMDATHSTGSAHSGMQSEEEAAAEQRLLLSLAQSVNGNNSRERHGRKPRPTNENFRRSFYRARP
jgi:hypothetical protein